MSISAQKKEIEKKIRQDFEDAEIVWFVDVAKGDSPKRKALLSFFAVHEEFSYAYAFNVDRFSRSWLGLMWFHEYFVGEQKPRLRFCREISSLYDKNGEIDPDQYMIFFLFCGLAQAELFKIRARTRAGRERILANPVLRKLKYPGRKPGSKNKKGA